MKVGQVPQAVMHVRSLNKQKPTHLFLCADSTLCAVKFQPIQQKRRLLSAIVGSRLCELVGISTPEYIKVHVPTFLINHSKDLAWLAALSLVREGCLYPATRFSGNITSGHSFDYLPDEYLTTDVNRESFIRILAFDQWCSCQGPPQPVFNKAFRGSLYDLILLNRSNCFAGDLAFKDSPLNGVFGRRQVYSQVTGWNSFENFFSRLFSLTPDDIWNATKELPFDLSIVHSTDLESLVGNLLSRRAQVRHLISKTRTALPSIFPNWTRNSFSAPRMTWKAQRREFAKDKVFQ